MRKEPLITVFMPMFNAEKYIREAIDSILGQTFKQFELLIIDDGSTDKSCEIVESYKDERIRLYFNGENKGLPYTRNRGLELARGKYLAIMDADDISVSRRLEIQFKYMEKHPGTVVLASGKDLLTAGEKKQETYSIKEKLYTFLFYRKSHQIGINLIFENVLSNSTTMIRLSFLKAKKIKYNSDCFVMQDYELWTQIFASGGQFHILRESLVKYRNNPTNITSRSRRNSIERRRNIQKNIQKNYLNMLGYNINDEWEMLISECGIEYEEKQNKNFEKYLDLLFLFYSKLIAEYPAKSYFDKKELINFLEMKYFVFAQKTNRKIHYMIKGISLGKY